MAWMRLLLMTSLAFGISACQSIIPKASGLSQSNWSAWSHSDYQRQDQVDVQWRKQSFSFLLYQQQQGQVLELVALSLTGQQLFQVDYDGQQVLVKQRIEQMRLLPFEFVVRDILLATYPNFAEQQHTAIYTQPTVNGQDIYIKQQLALKISALEQHIELDNVQVPYQMTFSPIENTLQPN